jgi:biotin carboxyl carrier protein
VSGLICPWPLLATRLTWTAPLAAGNWTIVDLLPLPVAAQAAGSLAAPMPGTVIRIQVELGAMVEPGQTIMVLEAMKMEHAVRAPQAGVLGPCWWRRAIRWTSGR